MKKRVRQYLAVMMTVIMLVMNYAGEFASAAERRDTSKANVYVYVQVNGTIPGLKARSEEHTSELQSLYS